MIKLFGWVMLILGASLTYLVGAQIWYYHQHVQRPTRLKYGAWLVLSILAVIAYDLFWVSPAGI